MTELNINTISKKSALLIALAAFLVVNLVSTIPILILAHFAGQKLIPMWPISGVCLGSSFYFYLGLRKFDPEEFAVIERFGQYLRTKKGGLTVLCLPGLIDKIKVRRDYRYHRLDLFTDEGDTIDFKDVSSTVFTQVWYAVVSRGKKSDEAEKLWAYRVADPQSKVGETMDSTVRTMLQQKTLEEASTNLKELSIKASSDQEAIESLRDIGVELDPHKGCLLTDINIPENLKAIRSESLAGKKEAEKQEATGAGYAMAIAAIIKKAEAANHTLTWQQAQEIYQTQRGLETVSKTGANISFVTPDMGGVLKTIGIK